MQIPGYWAAAICFEPLNFLCCLNGHLQNQAVDSNRNTVASFMWGKKVSSPHPSSFPFHSEMNVYSIPIREGTNYGTRLCTSKLYSSNKWRYILLFSPTELEYSPIFLFVTNWVTCFISLVFFLSLMSLICTSLLPSVSKGLLFASLPSDAQNAYSCYNFSSWTEYGMYAPYCCCPSY